MEIRALSDVIRGIKVIVDDTDSGHLDMFKPNRKLERPNTALAVCGLK